MENPNAKYNIKTEQYDVSYDDYMGYEKNFGHFSFDGKSYIVTDRNTPRQWLNFMVNDKFASIAGNDGSGFTALASCYLRITKFYCHTDYLVRTLNGKRRIVLTDKQGGREFDLLRDSKDMTYTVKPGAVVYSGSVGDIYFDIEIFVPNTDSCECWILKLKNNTEQAFKLTVSEDISMLNMPFENKTVITDQNIKLKTVDGKIFAKSENNLHFKEIWAVFALKDGIGDIKKYTEDSGDGRQLTYARAKLSKDILLNKKEMIYL